VLLTTILIFASYSLIKFFTVNRKTTNSAVNLSDSKNWKKYDSSLESYSFSYPSEWDLREEKNNGFDFPWISISPPVDPCPSNVNPFTCQTAEVIFIYSQDNPKNLSIQEFNGSNHSTYKPVTVSGIQGLRATVYGQFEEDTVFVKKGTRIYEISLVKNGGKAISDETFNSVIASFKFKK